MKCRPARKLLQPLLDDELSESVAANLRAHLQTCPRCRAEFAVLRSLDRALNDEPTVDPPLEMASAVVRRVTARYLTKRRLLIPAWLEAMTLCGVTVALGAGGFVAVGLLSASFNLQFSPAATAFAVATVVAVGLAAFSASFYRAEV